jgi:hypothetical protein
MPECYLDTNLVEFLLGRANSVNHKKGNSSVAATMNNKRFLDNFAVAVIDDDKRKLKELDGCLAVEKLWRDGLKLFKHPERKHYFIQLSPAIEKWILNECEKGEINIELYNLPGNFKELKNLKGFTQRNDQRFKELFADMLMNEKCDEMIELKRWLTFLKENNYNTNIDLL